MLGAPLLFLGLFVFFLASSVGYSLDMLRAFRKLEERCEANAVKRCRTAALRAVASLGFLGLASLQLVAKGLCGPEWGGLRLIWAAIRSAAMF